MTSTTTDATLQTTKQHQPICTSLTTIPSNNQYILLSNNTHYSLYNNNNKQIFVITQHPNHRVNNVHSTVADNSNSSAANTQDNDQRYNNSDNEDQDNRQTNSSTQLLQTNNNVIRYALFNYDNTLLILFNDNKHVEIYSIDSNNNSNTLTLHDSIVIDKKPTYAAIYNNNILISDKTGDIYSIDINFIQVDNIQQYKLMNYQLLATHLATITYINIIKHNNIQYILSCDSEGKLRISFYNNIHNILYMCHGTGHSYIDMCILQCTYNTTQQHIITGGIGHTLYIFDINSGQRISTIDIDQQRIDSSNTDILNVSKSYISNLVYNNKYNLIATTVYPHNNLYILQYNHNNDNDNDNAYDIVQTINICSDENNNNIRVINVTFDNSNLLYITTNQSIHTYQYDTNTQQYNATATDQQLLQQYTKLISDTESQAQSLSYELYSRIQNAVERRNRLREKNDNKKLKVK